MAYIYDLSDTWNAAGTTFYGIKMNVTNSASASGSRLISLQVGGTELFNVDKNGNATVSGSLSTGATVSTGSGVSTGNVIFELGGLRTGNGASFIDFHGTAGTDYDARMVRYGGANGGLDIVNLGTGGITVSAEGSGDVVIKTNATERIRVTNGGNLLIGTNSAFDNVSYLKFQSLGGVATKIAGTSLTTQVSFFNDNGRVGWIGTDGTITSYNITSDERLKENIADADDASSLIDAIQVRKFDWKANGSHQRYGFIAQELIEVAPEAVSAPLEEDQMMAVDYSKLVPMLVKEVQSLRARVAQLEGA